VSQAHDNRTLLIAFAANLGIAVATASSIR